MKIKILHMIHSLTGGGAEKQLSLLANAMDKATFEVNVFCVNDIGHEIDSSSVNIIVAQEKSPFKWEYIKEVWKAINKTKPDIVHVWLPASISIPAIFFAFIWKKKVIFSYRGRMTFNRGLCYPEFLMVLLFVHRIISNHPVTNSHWLYKWLYQIKKGQVIPNAVVVPERYQKTSIISSEPYTKFVYIGRLCAEKNPLNMIEAFALLKDTPGWILEIYGKGELGQQAKSLIAAHNLTEKITLNGFTSNPYQVMQRADCLIFPSLREGMPNVLVEAFSIGLPVVASDIVENKHIIGNSNSVVWINPEDINSISKGITNYMKISESELLMMMSNARNISYQYGIKKMTCGYESLYALMM